MFGLFKSDPTKKLEQEYSKLLEKAMNAQRNGDIELYGNLSHEAEEVLKKIDKIKAADAKS